MPKSKESLLEVIHLVSHNSIYPVVRVVANSERKLI